MVCKISQQRITIPFIAIYQKQFNLASVMFYPLLTILTVLFQAIQFSIDHLFTLSLNIKYKWIVPNRVLLLWTKIDLGAIALKGYLTFPKAPALLERYQLIV